MTYSTNALVQQTVSIPANRLGDFYAYIAQLHQENTMEPPEEFISVSQVSLKEPSSSKSSSPVEKHETPFNLYHSVVEHCSCGTCLEKLTRPDRVPWRLKGDLMDNCHQDYHRICDDLLIHITTAMPNVNFGVDRVPCGYIYKKVKADSQVELDNKFKLARLADQRQEKDDARRERWAEKQLKHVENKEKSLEEFEKQLADVEEQLAEQERKDKQVHSRMFTDHQRTQMLGRKEKLEKRHSWLVKKTHNLRKQPQTSTFVSTPPKKIEDSKLSPPKGKTAYGVSDTEWYTAANQKFKKKNAAEKKRERERSQLW